MKNLTGTHRFINIWTTINNTVSLIPLLGITILFLVNRADFKDYIGTGITNEQTLETFVRTILIILCAVTIIDIIPSISGFICIFRKNFLMDCIIKVIFNGLLFLCSIVLLSFKVLGFRIMGFLFISAFVFSIFDLILTIRIKRNEEK